jgi:phosphotransferase system enzyme I (PtsP)
VLSQSDGKPVTFRTLDIGGDKVLPYYLSDDDENPAMGWRGLRVGLDRPAILRQQLRALVRAAAGVDLRVMFPMVSSAAEAGAARELLEMELDRARRDGHAPPRAVQVGVMLEVPALIWQLPALFRNIDFIAVGSNDLMQFLFASDRGNPRLSRRFDALSPAVLKILREITAAGDESGVAVSVCGEMAGHPLEAMALLGCGVRTLSMTPGAVPAVRRMVRSVDLNRLRPLMAELSDAPALSLRERLRGYAKDNDIRV